MKLLYPGLRVRIVRNVGRQTSAFATLVGMEGTVYALIPDEEANLDRDYPGHTVLLAEPQYHGISFHPDDLEPQLLADIDQHAEREALEPA